MSKNIIVTGGSKGIGRAITKKLVKDGYNVFICARNEDELKETAAQLTGLGSLDYFVLDIADREAVKEFTLKWNEDLYGLVNNAGICKTERLDENLDTWDEVLNTNLQGVYFLTKGLIKHIVSNGRIINISSQNVF